MRAWAVFAAAIFSASLSSAEVLDSSSTGFTVKTTLQIKASPDDVYNKFVHNIGD